MRVLRRTRNRVRYAILRAFSAYFAIILQPQCPECLAELNKPLMALYPGIPGPLEPLPVHKCPSCKFLFVKFYSQWIKTTEQELNNI
jgi:hypothetical protein